MTDEDPPQGSPEQMLYAEVLAQAIRDLTHSNSALREDAREYLESESDRLLGARWACDMAGLHYDALIEAVRIFSLSRRYKHRRTVRYERRTRRAK